MAERLGSFENLEAGQVGAAEPVINAFVTHVPAGTAAGGFA
jgi:hypothetical protein